MKLGKLMAAAALLLSVAGFASAQDVTLPDKGTTEYNINGNINFDSDSSWSLSGRWAPFVSRNLQWGIDATVFDLGSGFDTSAFVGGLVNWYFRSENDTSVLPYIGAGIATTFGDANGSVWDIHGGIKYFVNPNVAFTAELQWLNFSDVPVGANDNTTQLNLGFSIFR
jgi:opacity protein-like surface antigen